MKKLLVILLSFLSSGLIMAQDLNLDELIKKNFKVIGQDKLMKTQTITQTGKMLTQGVELAMTTIQKKPHLQRVELEYQGTKVIYAYDGQNGWMIAPGSGTLDPQDMPAEMLKGFAENDDSFIGWDNPLFTWKELGKKIELVGKEDLNGITVFNIKITSKDSSVVNFYMDATKFVILKEKSSAIRQGQMVETETRYSEIKEVDGVMNAFRIEVLENGQTSVVFTFDKCEFDLPVDDGIFKKPVTNSK
jgi:outer membrane lipoprotein-sorting protein